MKIVAAKYSSNLCYGDKQQHKSQMRLIDDRNTMLSTKVFLSENGHDDILSGFSFACVSKLVCFLKSFRKMMSFEL